MDAKFTDLKKIRRLPEWAAVRKIILHGAATWLPLALAMVGLAFWFNGRQARTERALYDLSIDVAAVERREPTVAKYLTVIKTLAETPASKLGADECAEIGRVIVEGCSQNKDIGLEESIVFALIERESNFDPLALSDARAYGMGQLLWDTAAPHYRDMGFANLTTDLLFNPVLNVQASIRELARLRRSFLAQGVDSWQICLTAYYWGERWAWTLATKKATALSMLPSLEYGQGVMALAAKWKEKGL